MGKLVYGAGVYKKGKFTSKKFNKITKEYRIWSAMLQRCHSEIWKLKYQSYRNCTCSESFKDFQYFAEWCQKQIGFENDGWHLDKDILVKGNKHYSEDTCIFVPSRLNLAFVKNDKVRGELPVGVYFNKQMRKYRARLWLETGYTYLGSFDTSKEAFLTYKQQKEMYLKRLAETYAGLVDGRVIDALTQYVVEITD